jgi:putative FmdB family regulatory protein
MPLYEYRCKQCQTTFEKMVRWSEADRAPACPNCLSPDTHKKMSAIAAISGGSSSGNASSSASTGSCGSTGRFG